MRRLVALRTTELEELEVGMDGRDGDTVALTLTLTLTLVGVDDVVVVVVVVGGAVEPDAATATDEGDNVVVVLEVCIVTVRSRSKMIAQQSQCTRLARWTPSN
jgi:hypothetical protein